MKNKLLTVVVVLFSASAQADSKEDPRQDIDACLRAWGNHPFGKNPHFRTLKSNVKVMGIGSNTKDTVVTERPELVLVSPSVSVMSKQTFELRNPNGWYCLRGPVAVMGKSVIIANCMSHLASAEDGTTVAGSARHGGTAVMGKIQVKEECP